MTTGGTIKPGTASRLGLRKPLGPLLGTIRFPSTPPEQLAAFIEAFKAGPPSAGQWLFELDADDVTESRRERRRRLGLHWWQRAKEQS